jgi:hypothetical protein
VTSLHPEASKLSGRDAGAKLGFCVAFVIFIFIFIFIIFTFCSACSSRLQDKLFEGFPLLVVICNGTWMGITDLYAS